MTKKLHFYIFIAIINCSTPLVYGAALADEPSPYEFIKHSSELGKTFRWTSAVLISKPGHFIPHITDEDKMAFATVPIYITNPAWEKPHLTGTGFMIYHDAKHKLVTNHHVINGYLNDVNTADPGIQEKIKLRIFLHCVEPRTTNFVKLEASINHKEIRKEFKYGAIDPAVAHESVFWDLAVMDLSKLIDAANRSTGAEYFKESSITMDKFVTRPSDITYLHDIVMFGYPNCLINEVLNLPIARTGKTSTNPSVRHSAIARENLIDFMIDAACVGGSSGSPVWAISHSERNIVDVADNLVTAKVDPVPKFLGILWGGPKKLRAGGGITDDFIHIGYCIHAASLKRFLELSLTPIGEGPPYTGDID